MEDPKEVLRRLRELPRQEAARVIAGYRGRSLKELARAAGIPISRPAEEVRKLLLADSQWSVEHEALRTGRSVEDVRKNRS